MHKLLVVILLTLSNTTAMAEWTFITSTSTL